MRIWMHLIMLYVLALVRACKDAACHLPKAWQEQVRCTAKPIGSFHSAHPKEFFHTAQHNLL